MLRSTTIYVSRRLAGSRQTVGRFARIACGWLSGYSLSKYCWPYCQPMQSYDDALPPVGQKGYTGALPLENLRQRLSLQTMSARAYRIVAVEYYDRATG